MNQHEIDLRYVKAYLAPMTKRSLLPDAVEQMWHRLQPKKPDIQQRPEEKQKF
jgi:hypothetical protein